MRPRSAPLQCPCAGKYFTTVFSYDRPPEGEVRFDFSSGADYRREILHCAVCSHFVSVHDMDTGRLYEAEYVSANYGGQDGIRRAFERVVSLDPSESDNAGRVQRILEFAVEYLCPSDPSRMPSVLDVGSGIGVFAYKMKEAGWDCTVVDPDMLSVSHAQNVIGVKAIHADFMDIEDIGTFDIVTFNKVLEHLEDPVGMLQKSACHLRAGGFVYVEVPDGEAAMAEGPAREEFFIDHVHVFSVPSLALMADRAGFSVRALERLREPSTKYTLRAFLLRG